MQDHFWNYIKSGWAEDQIIGPVSEAVFAKMLREGSIGPKTKVMSQTRSKGAWLDVAQIPSCMKLVEQGVEERRQKKEEAAELKRQEQEAKEQQNAKQRQLIATEKQRQQEAEEARRMEARQQLIEQQEAQRFQPAQVIPAPHPAYQQPIVYQQPTFYQEVNSNQPVVNVTTVVVQPRQSNKALAVVLNVLLWPGLGQLTQGRVGVGIALMLSWFLSIILSFFCIGFFLLPVVWLIAVVDAAVND